MNKVTKACIITGINVTPTEEGVTLTSPRHNVKVRCYTGDLLCRVESPRDSVAKLIARSTDEWDVHHVRSADLVLEVDVGYNVETLYGVSLLA